MSKIWRPEDFLNAVHLVYDNSSILTDGDAPEFAPYQREVNASLKTGCITVGQEDFWLRREARKYNDAGQRDWRQRNFHPVTKHQPYGDPGPGYAAPVAQWSPKLRRGIFRWERRPRSISRRYGSEILPATVTVPEVALLNVNAYTPGDFKRFYADPRTRAQYLRWAPLLLGAEDWHAGRREWR